MINKNESKTTYTRHEVAEILADVFGDPCACNLNGNDEWLPDHCELGDACPSPAGVACWEQYLKHLDKRDKEIAEEPKKDEPVVERELRVRYQITQGAEDLYYCPETKRVYIRQPYVPGTVHWLTASHWQGGYEASCPIKAGIAMVVMDRKEEHELFREIIVSDGGCDTFAEKKGEFYSEAVDRICSEIADKYKLDDYKKWRKWLLSDKDKMGYKGYDDNWLYCEDELVGNETVENSLSILGMKVYVRRFRYKHKISNNKVWDSYIITSPSDKDGNICLGLCGYAINPSKKSAEPAHEPARDMLGYEVHDGDVVAVLCKEGFKGKYSTLRIGVVNGKKIDISEPVLPCYGPQSKILASSTFIKIMEGDYRESCK